MEPSIVVKLKSASLWNLKKRADALWQEAEEAAKKEEGSPEHQALYKQALDLYNELYTKLKNPDGSFKIVAGLNDQEVKEFINTFVVLGEAYLYAGRTDNEYNERARELYNHAIRLISDHPGIVSNIKINLIKLKIIVTKKQGADILWQTETSEDKHRAMKKYNEVYEEIIGYSFQELSTDLLSIPHDNIEQPSLQTGYRNAIIDAIFVCKVLGDCYFDTGMYDLSSNCYERAWDLLSKHQDIPEIFACLEAKNRNNILFNFIEAKSRLIEKNDIAQHIEVVKLLMQLLLNVKTHEGDTRQALQRRKNIAKAIVTQLQCSGIQIEGYRDENVLIYLLSGLLDKSQLERLPSVIFSQPLGPETSSRQLIDSIKTLLSQENIEKISRWVNTENTVEQVIGQIDKNIPALRARLHEQPRPGKPPLRPYQEEAITKYVEKVITGQTKCYIQMATGCGKTLVFVHLVKLLDLDKNLIVAPTKTIANQIIQELLFSDLYDEGAVGLFDSDDVHTFDSKVKIVVTTYQSVLSQWRLPPAKRKLNFQEAKLIILDEAHHALSKMVSEIVVDCSLHSLVLGATATPAYDTLRDRLSLSELEELLGPNSCVFSYDISKAIDDKILCPVTVKYLNFKERLSVRQARPTGLKKNDLSEGTLQKRINTEFYNNTIAEFLGNGTIVITSLAGTQTVVPLVKKKIVIFCPGIENAKALANTTNAKLKDNPYYLEQLKLSEKFMMAAAISGDMDSGEQKNIIGRFKEGKIQFLFGCDILIEGFNEPSVEVILNLRPTYSGLLEKQRCGRGLRLREDKTLIIIECTWPNIRRNQVYFSQFIQDQQQYGTDDTFAIFPNIDTGTPQELPFAITDIPSGALIKRKPVKKQPESIPSPLPELPTLFPIKHTIDISGEEEPQRKKHKFTTEGATPMEVQEPIPVLAVPAEYPADIGIFESFILACKNNPKGARQIMEYLMGLGNNLTILLLQACSYEYEHSKEAIQMLMDVGANSVEALLLLCRTNMGRPDENIAITNYTTLNNLIDQIPASNMENAFRVICCDEESVSDQVNKAILVMMIKNKITKDLLRSVFDEACNNNDLATIKNLIEYSRMVRFDQYMEKYYQQLKAKQPDSLSSPYPPAEKQLDVFFELDDALLIACEHGYFQMAKLLLEYNPDPHISHEGTLKIIESLVPANKEERKAKETVQDLLEGKYALGSTPSLSP